MADVWRCGDCGKQPADIWVFRDERVNLMAAKSKAQTTARAKTSGSAVKKPVSRAASAKSVKSAPKDKAHGVKAKVKTAAVSKAGPVKAKVAKPAAKPVVVKKPVAVKLYKIRNKRQAYA